MTKRIGIELNGVLRDTIGKFKQLYEHHMIGKSDNESTDIKYDMVFSGDTDEVIEMNEDDKINSFEYKVLSDVTSLDLTSHFAFQSKDDLYSFMYEDYTMELFGHAGSSETFTFNDLNDLYHKYRDNNDLIIVSDEIGKSKPASLFFLSKFGCLIETIKFYSEVTIDSMWDSVDILLTSNPDILKNIPKNKVVVKYKTNYNTEINAKYEIEKLSDFDDTLNKILSC